MITKVLNFLPERPYYVNCSIYPIMAHSEAAKTSEFKFLQGGGEMAELIAAYDWSQSPLGPIAGWSQNLRSSVSMMLRSRFPMLIFWGPSLITFYNDAFRPSLGNDGKHPGSLGQRGEESWAESWPVIGPMIYDIMKGGSAVWFEDQKLPLYRDGKMGYAYWTYSFSALSDGEGAIEGLLVTCAETTKAVESLQSLKESKDELDFAIEATELGTWDLDPATGRFTANDRIKDWFGIEAGGEIPLSMAIDVMDPADRQRVADAIAYATTYESGGRYEVRYSIINPGTQRRRHVLAKGRAWFGEDRKAYRFNGTLQDITEQVLAEQKRNEVEARFRNLLRDSTIGHVVMMGDNYTIKVANEAYAKIINHTVEQIMERPLFELIPDAEAFFRPLMERVLQTGEPFKMDGAPFNVLDAGGRQIEGFVDVVYQPYRDSDGNIAGVMAVVNNVTDQTRERKKLEEAEKKKTLALESGRFGTWDFNLLSDTVEIDARCRELFNMPPDEPIAPVDFWKYISEKDQPKVTEAVTASLDPQLRADYTLEYRIAGPEVRWIRNKGKGYFDNGVPYRFVGTVQDVTEERHLRDEQQKLLRLVENSVELMSLLGTNNINSYVNKAGMELLGFDSMEQVLRTPISELHLKEDFEKVASDVITSLQEKGRWSGQMNVKHLKSGEIIPVYNNTIRIDDPTTGEVLAFGAVMRDMRPELAAQQSLRESEQKYRQLSNELEERVERRTADLRNANFNLSRSNRDLEQFAYVASHDLQEPLRKIRMFSDLMMQNKDDAAFLDKLASKIALASAHMSSLVQALLNYSRLSPADPAFERTELQAVFKKVLADCELTIKDKGATVQLPPALPAIHGVPTQLYQLFLNLLGNALKFNEGSPLITVSCEPVRGSAISGGELIDPGAGYVHITFTDNGIGISKYLLDKVFTIFTRGTSDSRFAGTGIGLAVCKKVVENHRGHITVESEEGKGTSFHIYLPVE